MGSNLLKVYNKPTQSVSPTLKTLPNQPMPAYQNEEIKLMNFSERKDAPSASIKKTFKIS